MDKLKLLQRAAEFFKLNPSAWLKGALARDALGRAVHPSDPRATCWCAVGRIAKEMDLPVGQDPYAAVERVVGVPASRIHSLNDSTDVIATVSFLAQDLPSELAS